MLTLIVFLPMVVGFLLCFVWKEETRFIKSAAIAVSFVVLVLSIKLFVDFNDRSDFMPFGVEESGKGMQFVHDFKWISFFNIHYRVGIDGISLMMVVLTALLTLIAFLCSWTQVKIHEKPFYILLLFLEGGMMGVFCALDLFLFYLFWEAMLIPMYLIIGVWGGERRIYAAVKFMIYTVAGSLLMLAAILVLFSKTGSFDVVKLQEELPGLLTIETQRWLFLAFGVSFAIKVPLFPFHTWLPDAHVEAPTAGSVILAGVLLKMGVYGFLRFAIPFFPQAAIEFAPLMMTLGVIGIIFGALMAMTQSDIKKLIAYSSVSHLGFVMVGIFSMTHSGMQGGIYQMVNHGLSTGALFLLVGILYERTHRRGVDDYGGMAKVTPIYATIFMIVTLSSIALPGTNGFIGEFLILLGTFQYNNGYAVAAALGVVLGAVYMLRLYRDTMFGKVTIKANESVEDMRGNEQSYLMPILILIFVLGIFPSFFLKKTEGAARNVLSAVGVVCESSRQEEVGR